MRKRMVGRNGAHPLKGDADSDCFVIRSWHKAQNSQVLGGEEKQSNQAVSPGRFQETNLRVWKLGISLVRELMITHLIWGSFP